MRISQPLHVVGDLREYQQQLYIAVNMSNMRLSSAAAVEKSFQATEISDNLKIVNDSSIQEHSGNLWFFTK